MDYKGQKLSEWIYYIIIILFGIIGWILGFIEGDFYLSAKILGVGTCIALVLCVPDWPFYNRNKVTWLKALPPKDKEKSGSVKGKSASK